MQTLASASTQTHTTASTATASATRPNWCSWWWGRELWWSFQRFSQGHISWNHATLSGNLSVLYRYKWCIS